MKKNCDQKNNIENSIEYSMFDTNLTCRDQKSIKFDSNSNL